MSLEKHKGCIVRTQTTEGTDLKKSNYFRSKQMAQVTYRGIPYDTDARVQSQKTQQPQQKNLVYRGLKVKEENK